MLGPLLLVYIGFDFFQQNNGPSFRTLNDAIDLQGQNKTLINAQFSGGMHLLILSLIDEQRFSYIESIEIAQTVNGIPDIYVSIPNVIASLPFGNTSHFQIGFLVASENASSYYNNTQKSNKIGIKKSNAIRCGSIIAPCFSLEQLMKTEDFADLGINTVIFSPGIYKDWPKNGMKIQYQDFHNSLSIIGQGPSNTFFDICPNNRNPPKGKKRNIAEPALFDINIYAFYISRVSVILSDKKYTGPLIRSTAKDFWMDRVTIYTEIIKDEGNSSQSNKNKIKSRKYSNSIFDIDSGDGEGFDLKGENVDDYFNPQNGFKPTQPFVPKDNINYFQFAFIDVQNFALFTHVTFHSIFIPGIIIKMSNITASSQIFPISDDLQQQSFDQQKRLSLGFSEEDSVGLVGSISIHYPTGETKPQSKVWDEINEQVVEVSNCQFILPECIGNILFFNTTGFVSVKDFSSELPYATLGPDTPSKRSSSLVTEPLYQISPSAATTTLHSSTHYGSIYVENCVLLIHECNIQHINGGILRADNSVVYFYDINLVDTNKYGVGSFPEMPFWGVAIDSDITFDVIHSELDTNVNIRGQDQPFFQYSQSQEYDSDYIVEGWEPHIQIALYLERSQISVPKYVEILNETIITNTSNQQMNIDYNFLNRYTSFHPPKPSFSQKIPNTVQISKPQLFSSKIYIYGTNYLPQYTLHLTDPNEIFYTLPNPFFLTDESGSNADLSKTKVYIAQGTRANGREITSIETDIEDGPLISDFVYLEVDYQKKSSSAIFIFLAIGLAVIVVII
ncbi:MAG: hypothetical protein EZS28_007278, partial [Streblomastix strix]